ALVIRCPRQNMKTSIINGSEVSKLSLAIQRDNHFFSHFEVDDENPTFYKISRRRSMFGLDT
ncbi:hypothetical protein, partial [Atlantibacter hermannii]|uniref:hypothetical protein n=1 Tax=Atlantibacter hermannii TaxID=565 RepID=UPI00207359E0